MRDLILKTKIRVQSPYNGTTKMHFWNTLQVGDVVEINYTARKLYGAEATTINLLNLSTGNKTYEGGGSIQQRLCKFDWDYEP